MGFFDKFPYSNPYQLNLDWIIAQMRKFEADYNQLDPDSFLRKSGGLVDGLLQMAENGSIDMSGKPLTGLKTAVNSGDALPFGQAEGRYLRKTGGKMSGILDMDGHNITGLETPVSNSDAATKQYVDLKIGTPEEPGAYLPLAGGMMSGDLNMDGHSLTGIQNPINGLDAVNKAYIDGINGSIRQWATQEFAKNGFGLGKTLSGDALADANSATKSGWYKMSAETVNGIGSNCVIRVDAYGDNNCFQTAYLISSKSNTFIMRQCLSGVWSEWEWENPPCELGIEYRTTRRHRGYAVYQKTLRFVCQSQNIVYFDPEIGDNYKLYFGVYGFIYNQTLKYWFQIPSKYCYPAVGDETGFRLESTEFDMRNHVAEITIYYSK